MAFVGTMNNIIAYVITYGLAFLITFINFSVTVLYLDPQRRRSTDISGYFFIQYSQC